MIRISVPKTKTFRSKLISRQSGFSLIEILIVVGLIGLIMSLALPSLGTALKMSLNSSARELASIVRETHDEAVLKGQVYRLAFDIEKSEYWAEVGDQTFLMRNEDQEKEEKKIEERRNEEDRKKHKSTFALATAVTKRKLHLPQGVKFSEIFTSRTKEPSTAGVVYAYVFPHGFIEKLIIHVKDSYDREGTIVVNSVTGKSKVYERYYKEVEQ